MTSNLFWLTRIEALDEDFVDYSPPKVDRSVVETDWLAIRCHYASLCVSILKNSYSQRSLQSQNSNTVSDLEGQLRNWVESLPSWLQSMDHHALDLTILGSRVRATQLQIFFQYHEALLAIHTRRCRQSSTDPWLSDNGNVRSSSVRNILAISSHLTASDVRSDS